MGYYGILDRAPKGRDKGDFIVAAARCAVGGALALALLPSRPRRPADEHAETLAVSSARCPGAPSLGHLAAARTTAARRQEMAA